MLDLHPGDQTEGDVLVSLGLLAIFLLTLATGYFVAQEFAYVSAVALEIGFALATIIQMVLGAGQWRIDILSLVNEGDSNGNYPTRRRSR